MKKNTKLLRKQMELLAEQSVGAVDHDLAILTHAMCEVDRALVRDLLLRIALLFVTGLNLLVCVLVHIKKLFRRSI